MGRKIIVVVFLLFSIRSVAQDSIATPPARPEKPHELGIGVLTPLIWLTGATDNWDRHTNITYRFRVTEKHAWKVFAGMGSRNSFSPDPFNSGQIHSTGGTSYYLVSTKNRPSNFQAGIGYEYMFGNRLKNVPGIDLVYGNIFEKEEFYYMKGHDTVISPTITVSNFTRVDTGSYVRAKNYDRFGINLVYSLRYDISTKWVVTASAIAAMRFARTGKKGEYVSNFDLNIFPIGDVSVFYKF